MFRAKRQYFKLPKSCLGFCEETTELRKEKEKSNFLFSSFFSFLAVSFRGQILLKARTDWSPLGVKFKISDEHPRLFHIGVPPPPRGSGPEFQNFFHYCFLCRSIFNWDNHVNIVLQLIVHHFDQLVEHPQRSRFKSCLLLLV